MVPTEWRQEDLVAERTKGKRSDPGAGTLHWTATPTHYRSSKRPNTTTCTAVIPCRGGPHANDNHGARRRTAHGKRQVGKPRQRPSPLNLASHRASAHPTERTEGLRQPGTGRNSRNTNANQTSQMTGMGTHDLSPTSGQQCAHLRHKETTQGGGKLASHCELSNVTQGARGSTSSTSNASHKATAHPTKRMVRLRSPPCNT